VSRSEVRSRSVAARGVLGQSFAAVVAGDAATATLCPALRETGEPERFPLGSPVVRTLSGPTPKTRSTLVLVAVLSAVAGSVACGPSSDPGVFAIVFTVTETPSPLKTLEVEVRYDHGNFDGSGENVACALSADVNGSIAASDNEDGKLTVDIDASADPLVKGGNAFLCSFDSSDQPTSDDFSIEVAGATDNHDHPVPDLTDISVVVTSTASISSTTAAAGLTR